MNANEREYPWPMVKLGEAVTHRKEFITIDDDERYKRCRVQLHARGVVLRDIVEGSAIKTKKQQVCRAGEFLVAEIDAKVGGFGMVPPDLEGAIVSSHYFLFDINTDVLDRGFLDYYCRTPAFREQVAARGSTNYAAVRPARVLDYSIPLPPLPEQKRIVAKVQSLASKIDEARELRESINTDRTAALRSLFRRLTDGAPRRPMSEIAPLERRPVQIKEDESYPELGVRSFGRGTFHKPTLQGSELTWQKLFRIHSGDIVLSNIKAWEGAIGVATEEDHNRVGSHRYLTCAVNPDAATANFVCFYLLTSEGLEHVGHASPGSADRNRTLGMRALMDVPVPVPPLDTQHHFDRVHWQMTETTVAEADSDKKLDALMPAFLDRAFKGEL
jgi:type I restriction enzyme S subunit